MALGLIFGGCIILIYQKMKLQSKNYEILNKQKLWKKIYIYLPLTCFLFRNSLTTMYSKTIISSSGMSCKSSVWSFRSQRMFDSFVFLPLSTRAYFKGRAYIKIILKNHARSYFAGRSYYRGNTVAQAATHFWPFLGHHLSEDNESRKLIFGRLFNFLLYYKDQVSK